ncbi:MAG: hypothetical protein LBE84_09495 [Planctomycetota bacterium]|nr:hypothetical protein [Planctomycetota bacterium]
MRYSIDRRFLEAGPDVFRHRVGKETVYVKKRRNRKNPLGWLAQAVIHGLTGNPLTTPPPGPGRNSAVFEADRLEWLAGRGVDVPRVLHRSDSYFVMSDAGPGLDALVSRKPEKAKRLLPKAIGALKRLHNLGVAHGGAQIRNFTWLNGRVHLIDFEDDIPDNAFAAFQLRDIFLLAFSLERLGTDPNIADICRIYDSGDGETLERLCAALSGLSLARLLDNALLSSLGMRDIRGFIRLVDKAKHLKGGEAWP